MGKTPLYNRIGCAVAVCLVGAGWVFLASRTYRTFKAPQRSVGYTWERSSVNCRGFGAHGIAVAKSGSVFAAGVYSGAFRLKRGEQEWRHVSNNMGDCSVWSVGSDSKGTIYAGTGKGVYRSKDDGNSWSLVNTGLPTVGIKHFAEDSKGRVYAGGDNGAIYRSGDSGDHWKAIRKAQGFERGVSCIGITRSGAIFVGTSSDGLLRSTDDGKHWKSLVPKWVRDTSGEDSESSLGQIAVDADDNIYVAVDLCYYRFVGDKDKSWNDSFIYRSKDGGRNWDKLYFGDKRVICSKVAVDPKGRIIAGTRDGLLISSDKGKTWEEAQMSQSGFRSILPVTRSWVRDIASDSRYGVFVLVYGRSGAVYHGTAHRQ